MICMNRRLAFLMALILVLMKNSDAMLKVHGGANGAIYIRADGLIDPQTAPISSIDNVTYTFASDINGSIVVQRSNIMIDGNGYALEGPRTGNGFYLYGISNVTIRKTAIRGFENGILFYRTSNNTITGNIIEANSRHGIRFDSSLGTTIVGNVITKNNLKGISFQFASRNTISENNITNNYEGIYFDESHNNTVIGNIIATSNQYCILIYLSSGNTITRNTIATSDQYGIHLQKCSGTNIAGNKITSNRYDGIRLYMSSSNTIIRNNLTTNNDNGIDLYNSLENKILENDITSNDADGILLIYSSNNTLGRNKITKNKNNGIGASFSSNNTISGNTLLNNDDGIHFQDSSNNNIYHNNFVDNTNHWRSYGSTNVWDNGVEGNYWSNYTGADSDHDGTGDSPQILDANNQDNHPLMGMFHSFNTSSGYYVNIVSNSTIEDFEYLESSNTIKIYVSNITESQTFGFCRVCIPKGLMSPPYTVIVDEGLTEVLHFNETIYANSTHIWIYFAYEHPDHEVAIISGYGNYYSLFITVTLFMIVILLAVLVYRKKHTI